VPALEIAANDITERVIAGIWNRLPLDIRRDASPVTIPAVKDLAPENDNGLVQPMRLDVGDEVGEFLALKEWEEFCQRRECKIGIVKHLRSSSVLGTARRACFGLENKLSQQQPTAD
jgi:hypothetical protein